MARASRNTAKTALPAGSVNDLPYPPLRSIHLDPEDWRSATWRPFTPLPRPQPQPFDRPAALANLNEIFSSQTAYTQRWSKAAIAPILSPPEALFWLMAILLDQARPRPAQIAYQQLAEQPLDRSLSIEEAIDVLRIVNVSAHIPGLMISLANLFPLPVLIDILSDDRLFQPKSVSDSDLSRLKALLPNLRFPNHPTHHFFDWRLLCQLAGAFRQFVLPYCSIDEIEEMRSHLRPRLNLAYGIIQPPIISEQFGLYTLAAHLGMDAEVRSLVESWADGSGKFDPYFVMQDIVFGLGDAQQVNYHTRRLQLLLVRPEHLRTWLAHTEYAGLDYLRDCALNPHLQIGSPATLLETLTRVTAPEAAPYILELMLAARSPKLARRWLQENPTQAIAGLIPLVTGRNKLGDAAIEVLRTFKRKGYANYIQKCIAEASPEIQNRVQKLILDESELIELTNENTPAWWNEIAIAETSKKSKLPAWLELAELPAILIDKNCLNDQQTTQLLMALKQSSFAEPHPLITALKQYAQPLSLDAFAWKLFEIWQSEDAPPKENWAMIAVGLLGGDRAVLRLAPLIREMPGEGLHKRAVLGLECLRTIGTDTALMQINTIAQKIKFKGLRTKAQECMEAIAQSRHLTADQLEDRIVPDCGLDPSGTRWFDYGSRKFRFVFGSEMQPMLRDETGKLKNTLPKPNAKDDRDQAEAAIAAWKLMKQQVAAVVKTQVSRLERAMLNGRRWSIHEFETLLVHHPLMTNLVQRLVWGAYTPTGDCLATFRVTEDFTYANSDDIALQLGSLQSKLEDQDSLQIGVAHPAQLQTSELAQWGELFSDYELIQPFKQLSRTVFYLQPTETVQYVITRFQGIPIPSMIASAILDKTGWKLILRQSDRRQCHYKSFPFAEVTAVIEHPREFYVGYDSNLEINGCYFVPGIYPDAVLYEGDALRLKEIDPVVISEVLRNLGAIAAKSE